MKREIKLNSGKVTFASSLAIRQRRKVIPRIKQLQQRPPKPGRPLDDDDDYRWQEELPRMVNLISPQSFIATA